jgi:hypothetical protein
MRLNESELALAWFALLLEQKNHEKGSKMWTRHEELIQKIETKLRESDNALYKVSYTVHKYTE